MTTVGEVGEKRLIREVVAPLCGQVDDGIGFGVGDDAAMLRVRVGEAVVASADKIPEDLLALQFGVMSAFEHGRYLAMVNISDIAAMGARPLGLLAVFALPRDFPVDYLSELIRGMVTGAREWGIEVVGGDLGWGSAPCLSATALGAAQPATVLRRSGARVGDTIFVTGDVGGFGAALAYFGVAKSQGMALDDGDEEWLRRRLTWPAAHVNVGAALARSGKCSACMDVTDGLYQSLLELSEASGVGVEIEQDALPIHKVTAKVADFLGLTATDVALGIGLDLVLVGAVDPSGLDDRTLAPHLLPIGTVTEAAAELRLRTPEGLTALRGRGWQHFVGDAMAIIKEAYTKA